ncbi:unnamed protein product [marine sediment metagenome]|uniref:Uncharacterized protein n=1 Tax=marine sediment metagenome TaxID=412755 RepID=X1BD06_9ZZZZ
MRFKIIAKNNTQDKETKYSIIKNPRGIGSNIEKSKPEYI